MERGHKLLHAHSLALATTHLFGLVTNLLARLLEHHMHNDTTTSHCWCQATMAIAWMKEACVLWCPSTTTQHETYFMPSLDVKMSFVPLIATGCVIFLPSCFQSHPLTIFSSTTKKKEIMMIILSSVELWYYFYYCHDFSIELAIQVGARQKEMG